MEKLSKLDWEIIHSRVQSTTKRHRFKTLSLGFLSIVLEQIFPNIQDQLQESLTDGPDDRGVDAIHIISNDQTAEIYIFQSKYRDTYDGCRKTINESEILKISTFIDALFDRSRSLLNSNNLRLEESVQRIWSLHESGLYCRYHVIYCSNGSGFSAGAQALADEFSNRHSQVSIEFYSGTDLIKSLSLEGRPRENGSLQVVGKEIFERADGDIRGVVASVEARSFINLITSDDRMNIKRYLFEDNLRIFLGIRGGFNPNIINTATSQESYLFWYLNNGITITCKNYSYNKGHTNPVIKFDDFQIVNGAQTSHSLVEAVRLSRDSLDDVILTVKIYATNRTDFVERIAVATNSQARIQSRDLCANLQIMKKLELAFAERGYFFERKRNMHADKPDDKRIDALKLGQIIMAYELREPDRAKTDSDSIFDSRFNSIFHENRNIDNTIRIFELYQKIESMRDSYILDFGSSPESGRNERYLIYGHWFVLYTCNLLNIKSKRKYIPVGKEADMLIMESISVVAKACSQQKAVAHYQIFRSPRTMDKIYAELSGIQLDLLDLLADQTTP